MPIFLYSQPVQKLLAEFINQPEWSPLFASQLIIGLNPVFTDEAQFFEVAATSMFQDEINYKLGIEVLKRFKNAYPERKTMKPTDFIGWYVTEFSSKNNQPTIDKPPPEVFGNYPAFTAKATSPQTNSATQIYPNPNSNDYSKWQPNPNRPHPMDRLIVDALTKLRMNFKGNIGLKEIWEEMKIIALNEPPAPVQGFKPNLGITYHGDNMTVQHYTYEALKKRLKRHQKKTTS